MRTAPEIVRPSADLGDLGETKDLLEPVHIKMKKGKPGRDPRA